MTAKISFGYYDGSNKKRPPMSKALWEIIQDAVASVGATKCHIVHLGTVGDPKTHRPGTSHMQEPPEAIDVVKIYLHFPGGHKIMIFMGYQDDMTDSIINRRTVAKVWKNYWGVCVHVRDKSKGHIHLQVPKSAWGGG